MRMNHGSRLSPRLVAPLLFAVALSIALVGTTSAKGRPGGGAGGGGKTCAQAAPAVAVDNNWSWSGWGSWGLPGQQLSYAINVINYDVGCAAASFVVDVQAPSGFTVSVPTSTISLKATTNGYLWAYVASPSVATDGDYPVTFSVRRAGTDSPVSSFTSYFKVYTTDSTAPTLFWANPADGQVIDARSVSITASSSDDHAVRSMDVYVDGAFVATTTCDDVTYICQVSATWPATSGSHTATFWSYDWTGHGGSLTVSFTVGSTGGKNATSSSTVLAATTDLPSHRPIDGGHGKSTRTDAASKGQTQGHGPKH
jgi:hypothetical protein